MQRGERRHRAVARRAGLELDEEVLQRSRVGIEVERRDVGVREPQRRDAPDPRQRSVVRERRITDVLHPVVVVVRRMIDAVVAAEAEVDDRPAEVVQEYRVVRTAADAGVDELAVGRKLPVNLVLVAEGEEEIGSPHFGDVVHRPEVMEALRGCEGVFMPFASQSPDGDVEIALGAKGIIELELVSSGAHSGRGPAKDVHSSLKAALDSPAWRLVQALHTLVTPDGNDPAIDGWFDEVQPLSAHEKDLVAAAVAHSSEATRMKSLGVKHWVHDASYREAMERLAGQPTINIEGLVSGYIGQGGKTILPGRAVAKVDCRLVPNQTAEASAAKLRAHLDKHGFTDIEVNVTGGYDPTTTDEHSRLIEVSQTIYRRHSIEPGLNPRLGGSWPGYIFTGGPLKLSGGHFGLGHGSGAHAPDEYYVIESANPKVAGFDDAVMSYVEYLYELGARSA